VNVSIDKVRSEGGELVFEGKPTAFTTEKAKNARMI
jgi:hypothetical protein